MQVDDNYWPYLQAALGIVLVSMALCFAFPKMKTALMIVVTATVAASVFIPGLPAWLRIGCVILAVGASVALFMGRRKEIRRP